MVMRQLGAEYVNFLENHFLFIEDLIAIRNRQSALQNPGNFGSNVYWSCCGNQLVQHFKRWNGHGEALDPKSGRHNLLHVARQAMLLWSLERAGAGKDDRPSTTAVQIIAATHPDNEMGNL